MKYVRAMPPITPTNDRTIVELDFGGAGIDEENPIV
jgi:hypothetical protein